MAQTVDFVGIGAQKSGTTWTFECIKEHPETNTPRETAHNSKELEFFNKYFLRGYDWYHQKFDELGEKLCGEFSVLYLPDPNACRRIHNYNSDLKLLACFRNPVERAFSQHKMMMSGDVYSDDIDSFDKALQENPSYVEMGCYASQLEKYLDLFSRDQFHFVFFEDIVDAPEATVKSLYEFLGLNASFVPSIVDCRVNESLDFRSELIVEVKNVLRRFFRGTFGENSLDLVKTTGLPWLINRLNIKDPDRHFAPPSESTYNRLLEGFRPEINKLEAITGRDLSCWLKPYDEVFGSPDGNSGMNQDHE